MATVIYRVAARNALSSLHQVAVDGTPSGACLSETLVISSLP
jgi:hypothetical protein